MSSSKDCAYQFLTLIIEGMSDILSGSSCKSLTRCARRTGSSSIKNEPARYNVPGLAFRPKMTICRKETAVGANEANLLIFDHSLDDMLYALYVRIGIRTSLGCWFSTPALEPYSSSPCRWSQPQIGRRLLATWCHVPSCQRARSDLLRTRRGRKSHSGLFCPPAA